MKFLATGDLQCHKWRQFSYILKNGMNSRLANCLKVFDVLLEEAKKHGIKKIVINGDIFEDTTYIDVEVYDGVYRKLETLHSAGMEIVINLGNHDISMVYGQFGGRVLHSLRAFRKVAIVVEKPTLVWEHLFVVPWNSSANSIKEAIKSAPASKEMCLILHCGIQGARVGPRSVPIRSKIGLEDLRRDEFGLVLLSDYHTRQRLAKNVWYIGSPLQHTFGEIHRPCIWSVGLDREGLFTTKKMYTDFPRFRRWDSGTSDWSAFQKAARDFRGDYVRIDVGPTDSGRYEQIVKRYAAEYGFQFQIRSGREELSDAEPMSRKQLDARRAFRKYVRREVEGKFRQEKLLELGHKLYRGEM